MTKWVTKKFDDFFDMLPTNTLSRDKLNDQFGIYQNIHYGDVLIKFPFCLDCGNNEIPYINEGENFNKTELKDGDVVFADTAEDDTVGKCVEVLNVGDKKIVSGLHTYLCRPKFKMAPGYLGYFLNSDAFHNQLLRYIAGSKVSSVNKTSIKNTSIFYPESLAEQKRIASILSSADNVIATSEALIEKYKSIKQGMLTDLLTPKKGWKKVKLGECCEIGDGLHGTPKYDDTGEYYFINGNNIKDGIINIKDDTEKVDEEVYNKHKIALTRETILMSINGTIGNLAYYNDEKVVLGKSVAYFMIQKSIIIDYLYYYLQSCEANNYFDLCLTGSTIKNLGLTQLRDMTVYIPDLAEQHRIAEILSSVDAKIAAEEKVVEKYKGVKKGLMEEMMGREKINN